MFGGGIALLVVFAVIGGLALWTKRKGPGSPETRDTEPHDAQSPRRVSLLTEAVGYIGTILVLAGASAAIGQRWADINTGGRLVILGSATVIFLGVGTFVRSSTESAFQRLTSAVWAVSLAGFAGSVAVINQFYDTSGRTAFLTIATAATAYAGALWRLHQRAIQQAAMFLGCLLSTASILVYLIHEPDAWMVAVPLWAIGLAWAAAGWWRRITPWFIAVPLGLLVALIAPATMENVSALRFGLGIGTAATVMALSVTAKFTPGLGLAAVAMLGYVIGAVTYYFGDTLGVPASLAVAGFVILAMAAAATRWHWFSDTKPPADPPSTDADVSHGTPDSAGRHAA